jgi:hypothetical protein
MKAPARENDPGELDRFKQSIDLVDYAQRHGYQVSKEDKKGNWHLLDKDDEKLLVTRKGDHQVYLNTGNERDSGSVIDFAKTRGGDGQGLNLGQVRQELRQYLDGNPAPPREYATPVDISRLNALPVGDPNRDKQVEEDRKTQLIAEVLGVKKELTDRSYLHGRGIEDKTIDNPAFQGRIFTAQQNEYKNTAFPLYNEQGLASVEQKNENWKNLLELPKNGIWVSHPTEGKDTKVDRVVVSESAVDSLSHHQLKHGQDQKNTMYIATSGTPTEAQVALIQRVIDKQEPKEVVLANDNDAGGRKFNINYLNELHPARPLTPVADLEAYKEPTRPVEWHATSDKYHTGLKVTYHHDSPEQKTQQVQQLTDRVGQINSTQEAGPSVALEVQRSNDRETVLRLSVAKSDTAQLEVVAHELYRQREQLRPEPERQKEAFIRVDYPMAKDWNRDLELTQQGLSAEQIRAQAQRDEQQRETERQQRLAEQLRQEQEQRQQERRQQEQTRLDDSPEAQAEKAKRIEQGEKQLIAALNAPSQTDQRTVEALAAATDSPNRSYRNEQEAREQTTQFTALREGGVVLLKEWMNDNPPPTGRKVDEAQLEENRDRARYAEPVPALSLPTAPVAEGKPVEEKVATWRVDELTPNSTGRAEAWKEVLESGGYIKTGEVRSSVDERGIRSAEFDMRYRNDQPEIAFINAIVENTRARAESGHEKYAGVSISETPQDRAERQDAASRAEVQPQRATPAAELQSPEQQKPGVDKTTPEKVAEKPDAEKEAIVRVDEKAPAPGARGQAEAVKDAITNSGAKAGDVRSTTDEQGIRHSEIQISYRTDQPEINRISQTLDAIGKQKGNEVIEHSRDRTERRELSKGIEAAIPGRTQEITR